jgi:DNA-binding transcriptional ArsR family regulator
MTYHSPDLDSLFQALSDPTRRAILTRLAKGPAPVSALAEPFEMALPSFMGHLKRLEDGGLIETTKSGRVRTCAMRPGALEPARSWIDEQRAIWESRLDRLDDYVTKLMKERADETRSKD